MKNCPVTRFFKALFRAGVAEVKEIETLKPTSEDYAQGQRLATLTASAMIAMGCPCPPLATQIMEKVYAYGIRDMKDGLETPDKLIVKRIVNEIRKEKAKAKEEGQDK